jgi:hypothetical protein
VLLDELLRNDGIIGKGGPLAKDCSWAEIAAVCESPITSSTLLECVGVVGLELRRVCVVEVAGGGSRACSRSATKRSQVRNAWNSFSHHLRRSVVLLALATSCMTYAATLGTRCHAFMFPFRRLSSHARNW